MCVNEVNVRRKLNRHIEPLIDAGVKFDVHDVEVFDAQRISQRPGNE